MILKDYTNTSEIYQYYTSFTKNHTNHIILEKQDFVTKMLRNKFVLTSHKHDNINGFLSAVKAKDKIYVSILYGSIEVQQKLMKTLEQQIKNTTYKSIWFHFFNPVHIPWYPLPDVTHPSIQGVNLHSDTHQMLSKLGYQDNSIQETYYLNLSEFKEDFIHHPESMITYEIYNPNKHQDFYKFLKKLHVPHWHKYLMENDSSISPLPVLVALDNNHVIGFAGPLKKEESKRGYFGGIGVLDTYRGRKIGKYLFHNLCKKLKEIDAAYMTLFTGVNNVGKYIYTNAGCKVVHQFITLKKIAE